MENWFAVILFIIIAIPIYYIVIQREKRKVENYIEEKYGPITEFMIKWTLFGPFAPGSNNSKFRVSFIDQNGILHELFAVTSLFGSVYIRE